MARRDRVLKFTGGLLRVLVVLNIACAAAFVAGLLATWPFADLLSAKVAARWGGQVGAGQVIDGLRFALLLAIVAAVPAHLIFSRLRAIVATVRDGDTFAPANAARVRAIGWALFAIQLFDLPLIYIVRHFREIGVEAGTYSPSVGGWLSVLVAFVLARVFADGAAMRDDLEGTV